MGIIAAAFTPYVQQLVFGYPKWWTYVVSVFITYAVFLVLYIGVKAVLLLIKRDKKLELAEAGIPQLESQLRQEHLDQLEELSSQGHFWVYYANQITPLWRDGVARWSQYTAKQLGLNYGESSEKAFNTFDGMDKQTDGLELRYLNRRLANLRTIIQSITSGNVSSS